MKISEEQKERANRVNLPEFLLANGFDLKKVGREYVWKEHDSLHIKDNEPGQRGAWYRFSEHQGGDNIGFLREYMNMSFADAVEALTGEQIDRSYTPTHTYEPKREQPKARELSLAEADNARRVFAYLCKTRGLDYNIISSFVKSGVIAQEQKTGNVLFKYYDDLGKVIGAEKVGTSTEHKFKGIATGSAGGHGFEVCRGDGSNLLFFESSIDMLSYLQMFSPDNCRLVSMMGVKPNIVLDTMVRYGIAPQNVYLCSDNDTAGNEFADRLREEYPDMKRIATPDTYKDWNDMLRGISKAKQKSETKEADSMANLQYFGNEMWNRATDNRDKSLVSMPIADFQRVQNALENSGINYYAYASNSTVRMAVNDKDIDWLRQLIGEMSVSKSNRAYSPPEKNIIGNAEYRYIPQKEYFSADRDMILKMAEIMNQRGIHFSGRIYPTGKGTLTVSHDDIFAVRNIQNEIVAMRKQFVPNEKVVEVGNRGYDASLDTYHYVSKLNPDQFREIKPYLETGIAYHAIANYGRVAFAVEKENAPAFHRALENAEREVGMLHMADELGLSAEQMAELKPVIHRLAVEDVRIQLADFFDRKYDEAQFGEMLSLVNAYLAKSPAERYGENSKLSEILESKSNFDRSIELSIVFSLHDFSDEQRAAITAMYVGGVTMGQIDCIDETFTVEDIQAYDEILHTALQESDITDFLNAHRQAVSERENAPTEEEQVLFSQANLAMFIAEGTLSSDEWEDMAYPMFERGYLDKHKPSDKAILGYHLSEPAFYDLAHRFHDGDDIRRELSLGLMEHSNTDDIEFVFEDGKISDRTYYYEENLHHSLHTERTEDGYKCSFGGMERFVSFEEIGQAFIDRIHEEFEDLAYWRVLDYIRDDIPDISDDKVRALISAFDSAAVADWEKGDNQPKINRIKKALFDILNNEEQTEMAFACIAKQKYNVTFEAKEPDSIEFHFGSGENDEWISESDLAHDFAMAHPDCSFALGNAIFEYLDEKQHSEREIKELHAGYYKKTDFTIHAVINGETFNYEGRFDIGDGKGTGGGSLIDHIRDYNQGVLDYTQYPYNQPEHKERAKHTLDVVIPFLEAHSALTAEEQKILDDFKAQHPIRTVDDIDIGEPDTFKLYQLKEGEEYHGVRFETLERVKLHGVQLNTDDYNLVYEGNLSDYSGDSIEAKLEALYEEFNINRPIDFTGHSMSVSDVVVVGNNAYYCNDIGFVEFPEFLREKEMESPVVSAFRAKTEEQFEAIDGNTPTMIENHVKDFVAAVFVENGVDAEIIGAAVTGSRSRGLENADSDIDVVIEVNSDLKEDALFNLIHETEFSVGGVSVDINPIKADETGTLETYLPAVEQYLVEKANGFEILSKADVPEVKKVHQVVTNAGFDGGIDDKLEYVTAEEAIQAGKGYLADGYLGFAVLNQDTKEIEHVEGDFPVEKAFSEEVLRISGLHETENKVQDNVNKMEINEESEIDKPLFTDASVIEEIQKNEHSDVPLSEMPDTQGEQLSLFDFDEPISFSKPEKKSEFAKGPVVDGVQVYKALAAEIDRGTGFVNGKFRVQDFYEEKRPTIQQLADFLKKEYGIGGHSGDGAISFVDFDIKGLTFSFENGEKFRHSWYNVAVMTMARLEDNTYLSAEQKAERDALKAENSAVIPEEKNSNIPTVKNLAQLKKALKPSMMFEITDHLRPECIGERRIVTGVSTVDFTSRKLDENGEPTGKDLHMEFDRAKNWNFDGSELTSRLDNGDILMSFHFINGSEHTKEPKREPVTAGVGGDDTIINGTDEIVSSTPTPDKSDNFTITDDALGEGGAKAKFRANTEAIRTLKTLEAEHRTATDEEKEVLSKYVGWGAISKAFDRTDEKWSAESAELAELLTPEEYRQARASVNDAFFTAPVVIDAIYEALGNFGFNGGTVLEPSMGVGNFFGRMPEDMQRNSQLYGMELDSLTGRIAQALYPDADIAVKGFEQNTFQNGCFDVAVGNVPFGELGFKDEKHGTAKLHDYFFAESLDKLKNGGIMAFVTSAGTLDKRDETTRQMLAEKADFIGAIRLPGGKNGAFKDNAGTEVTTDIIFFQKHDGKSVAEMSDTPDWVHIGETADGLPINKYFEQHPDMVLGTVVEGNKLYGSGTMVVADEEFDLKSALHEAVGKLSAKINPEHGKDVYARTADGVQVEIPSNLRNYSFFLSDDQVFFKKNNIAYEFRFDKKTAQHKRFKAFIELRNLTRELLEAQEHDKSDDVIKDLQAKLNVAYDDFYAKYGLIHSQTNKRYFSEDVSYNLVAGLEKKYDKTKLVEKSDIFTKRTIVPPKAVDHVETALEALTLSAAEKARVDFAYMGKLTGMSEDELKKELSGEIFKIPHSYDLYQTASEYLSGDIRKKLREAEEIAEYDADFNVNVSALKAAMPEPLKAGDIDIKLGATWLDPKYYEQFIYELLQTPAYQRSDSPSARWNKNSIIGVEYSVHTNSFHVSCKGADKSVLATQKFGSHKMNAYDIYEHILNLQEPKVYKSVEYIDDFGEAKEKRVVDIDATRVVQRKADDMRKAFKNWIFRDPVRRDEIVTRYNELFNSIRPREFDGSSLSFPMMTSDIKLHDHQKNAIAHAMFGGNTLFAHCVGAGKTFEMIATAIESKRLGLCTKSMFAVPNHLTEQIGSDFQQLYPSANILVATKKDFKKENRQQLFAKIATGNYDAVIIGHSQLGMIPVSKERQVMTIQAQIDDILLGIAELKEKEGSKFQIKAMERSRKSLQKQLDKLEKANQDDTLTFEQLGIDKLFVDEAHEFKNLFVSTKLSNVAGISSSASQKALELFLKCRYLDEKTGGKGVVFATGTPLSNSITELHTMMRYLEYDFLKDHDLQHFDSWVAVFGEQKTDWELAPAGNKFKERTRISNYSGLPELMSMFKQIADIRTADTLKLDVPECEYKVVQVEATSFQQELVQELADRADAINAGNVDPSIDNMLKITSDGRKLGLDPRLIDPTFEDDPSTKLNQCVENVARIHAETAEDRLTQIIFCDLGVPHKNAGEAEVESDDADDTKSAAERESLEEECNFCVYDDIRSKLIAKGIPAEEIAFIHDVKTEKQKSDLFEKVRNGEIRVLLGSTAKMGTGTNVQKKLIAVHDLDIPWRPADLEQRAGRIIRQGNENKNVQIFRYVTKGTFDAYSYQTLENKQRFISQIMTSKTPARKCEDVDQQALTYSEIKALCTGDERIKEKLMLENEVKELRVLASEHKNTVYEMQDKIQAFPEKEQRLLAILDDLHTDREALRKLPIDPERKMPVFKITIEGTEYTDRKEAAKALETAALAIRYADTPVKVGSFQGFDFMITVNSGMMGGDKTACLKGAASHTTKLIDSFAHNLNRLESALYNIDGRIGAVNENLAKLRVDFAEAQKIVSEPFPQLAELESKEERLKDLTTALNLAAIEAKKNAPKREQTCYFDRAKQRKEAARVAMERSKPSKSKSKAKKKPEIE